MWNKFTIVTPALELDLQCFFKSYKIREFEVLLSFSGLMKSF